MRPLLKTLAGPALVFLICVGFYWKLTLTTQYTWLDSPDIANMDVPRFQFMATEFHRGHFPLWDPHHWMGQPFLGQFTGLAYPINWLLALMPLDKAGKLSRDTLNWYFVLIRFLGGLFCYLLCRDSRLSKTAAVIAASIFMFGGLIGSTDWPEVINGTIWTPLVFLFLFRALRGVHPMASAALSGMFLGVPWLAGHHEVPIYVSFTVAGVWIWAILDARRSALRVVRLAAVAFLFTFLTSGFQTIPGYEFGKLAMRWAGVELPLHWKEAVPYIVHNEYSFTPASFLGIVFSGLYRHVNPFVGIAAVALAVTGTVLGWQRREVRVLTVIGIATLMFALASNNVLHGVLYAVLPIFGKARLPARIIGVFGFPVAILAAFGLDAIRNALDTVWVRRTILALAGIGAAIFLVTLSFALALRFDSGQSQAITAVIALLLAAVLEAWRRQAITPRAALFVIPLLVIVELGNNGLDFANRYDKKRGTWTRNLNQNPDIIRFLKQQTMPIRVQYPDQEIPINLGDWEGIDTQGGFTAAVTRNQVLEEGHLKRTRDLFAVNFTIAKTPTQDNQEVAWPGESGLKVYRNRDAFPRAWAAHNILRFASREELLPRLQDPNINLRNTILMTGAAPRVDHCDDAGDQVIYNGSTANGVSLTARMACRGMVILADTYYPGWRAKVDGKVVPIYETYGALRGVVVDAGPHRIEYRYVPATAIAGAIMTFLGIFGAIAMAVFLPKH